MPEKDFVVSSVVLPQVGNVSKKPSYLVVLTDPVAKNKSLSIFIAVDKPDLLNGFIQVKGIFSEFSEEETIKKFNEILSSTAKESILDIMFPWHRVQSIRNLVFNANKPSTLIK